jgi:hypothetical protein
MDLLCINLYHLTALELCRMTFNMREKHSVNMIIPVSAVFWNYSLVHSVGCEKSFLYGLPAERF